MTLAARVSAVVNSAKGVGRSLDDETMATAGCARGVVAAVKKSLPGYPDALPEGVDRLHFLGAWEQKLG